MGRPLKIKKTTTKDIGFVELGQLESPVYPDTLNTDQFIGVVGGANAIGGPGHIKLILAYRSLRLAPRL